MTCSTTQVSAEEEGRMLIISSELRLNVLFDLASVL